VFFGNLCSISDAVPSRTPLSSHDEKLAFSARKEIFLPEDGKSAMSGELYPVFVWVMQLVSVLLESGAN
jgi:hypothetical protein